MRLKQFAIRFALGVAAIGFSGVMYNDNYNSLAAESYDYTEDGLGYLVLEDHVVIVGYNNNLDTLKAIQIPVVINGVPVTEIAGEAFKDSNITKIIIPESVVTISDNSFDGCDNLTILGSVDSYAFEFAKYYNINFEDNNHSWVLFNIEPATKSKDGKIIYHCSNEVAEDTYCSGEKTETINKIDKITLSATSYTYTGSEIKPAVTVKDSTGSVVNKSFYTVKYSKNVEVGKASVTVAFNDYYSGIENFSFNINPTVTSISTPTIAKDGITVKWTKNTSGNGYDIYRSVNGASFTKVKSISDNTTVSWKDTTAKTNGAEYRYKIITTKTIDNVVYKSGYSGIKTIYFLTQPAVTLSNTSANVKLSWGKNSNATGYYIYKSTDGGKTYSKYSTVTSNSTVSFSDTNAKVNGTKYAYKIVTYKTVGDTTYKSVESSAKDYYFVTAPTLSMEIASNGMMLSWTKNSSATGYYIYRSTDGTNYTKLKTITSNATLAYTDTTANTNGTKYYYKVNAYKTVNSTNFTSAFSGAKYRYFVSVPTLKLSNASYSVKLKWDKNDKATGYYIYKSTDGGKTYKKYKTITSNSTVSYSDPNANTNGTKYYYKISAYKTVNGSNFVSAYSDAKTHYFYSSSTLKFSNSVNGIVLEWKKNPKATGYYIYRCTDGKSFSKIQTITNKDIIKYFDYTANTNGKKYYYRVVTYGTVGSKTYISAYSSTNSDVYLNKTTVKVSGVSTGAKITWTKNSAATGYYIYRSTDGKKYSKIKTVTGASNVSYIDKISGSSSKYLYKVVVFKTINGVTYTSANSNIKSLQMLTKPTINRFTNVPGKKLVVRWDKIKDAAGYEVNYSLDKNFKDANSFTIKNNTRYSYLIQNVSAGKVYYVRVRSYAMVGNTKVYSDWSAAKSVTAKSVSNNGYSNITIGDTYVDLDLGKQHVYVYKSGKLVQDMDCVSGCTGWGMGTPAGLYKINTLERNATLVGADYVTVVAYWIGFIGNEMGFHDASWKTKFGGEIYKTDGSHGCINLAPENAKTMFGLTYVGMPVITYY